MIENKFNILSGLERKVVIVNIKIARITNLSLTKEQKDFLDTLSKEEYAYYLDDKPDKKISYMILIRANALKTEAREISSVDDDSEIIQKIIDEYSDYFIPFINGVPEDTQSFLEEYIATLVLEYMTKNLDDFEYIKKARDSSKPNVYNKKLDSSIQKIQKLTKHNPNTEKIQELLKELENESQKGLSKLEPVNLIQMIDTKDRVIDALAFILKPYAIPKLQQHMRELKKIL